MPEPAEAPSTLDVALRYAQCGVRVLPIKPGTKRPPMREWVDAATTDPTILTNWFTGMYANHGVGLAMGRQPDGRFLFAVDVDEHDPAASGRDTLYDLERAHEPLPDTWRSITGSDGLHLLFVVEGIEVRNGTLGPGLDIRGEGGQIVVAPSLHPSTGRGYEWEHGFAPWERPVATAPDWLVVKLMSGTLDRTTPAPAPIQQPAQPAWGSIADPDSPAEWLRANWNWHVQLHDAGWTEHHVDRRTGDTFWTRPGKDARDGESAILHEPGGPFVVFTTDASVTGLRAVARHVNRDGSVSVTPFEFYAAMRHGGDLTAAGRAIGQMMNPSPASRLSAVPTPSLPGAPDPDSDAALIADYLSQELDWGEFWRDDDHADDWVAEPLIAAGRLTAVYAPAKQGKSEVVLAVTAALASGKPILGQRNFAGPQHVVYLDYEMTRADLRERLELLGYTDRDDLSHLHYFSLPSLPPLDTVLGASVLRRIARERKAKVVVIDTMGRAVEGEENDNDTYRDFARYTGLALKADGVAVVRTDHAGKDRERGQRGASAKNDDADVVFRVGRIDDGWRLDRTHSRVNWVPEVVLIDREEIVDPATGEVTLRIELRNQPGAGAYPPGTKQLFDELTQVHGVTIDATTTVGQLMAAAKKAGLNRRKNAIAAALKWGKESLPAFTGGPTPLNLAESDDEPGDTPSDRHGEAVSSPSPASGGPAAPAEPDTPADSRLSAPTLGDIL